MVYKILRIKWETGNLNCWAQHVKQFLIQNAKLLKRNAHWEFWFKRNKKTRNLSIVWRLTILCGGKRCSTKREKQLLSCRETVIWSWNIKPGMSSWNYTESSGRGSWEQRRRTLCLGEQPRVIRNLQQRVRLQSQIRFVWCLVRKRWGSAIMFLCSSVFSGVTWIKTTRAKRAKRRLIHVLDSGLENFEITFLTWTINSGKMFLFLMLYSGRTLKGTKWRIIE